MYFLPSLSLSSPPPSLFVLGVGGAEKGTLTFMVGGDKSSFENAKPYLAAMGKNIVHCGASGSGQIVKLCNNLLLAISMIGTSEVMNLGTTMGMDAKVYIE